MVCMDANNDDADYGDDDDDMIIATIITALRGKRHVQPDNDLVLNTA